MPVHQPPGGIREAAVVNTRRQRALPAQDAVPGRHHARHFRTIGFHCKAGRPGTEAQSQPNPLPRGVRTQQSAPGVGHAGKTGQGQQGQGADEPATPAQRRASMTWAQRLKRVFNIDIETCSGCGGAMKVIACIEDPIVIKQILDHLKHKAETSGTRALPESRAPPAELLLGLFD